MEEFISSTMRLKKGERDITILEVEARGTDSSITFRMLDKFDDKKEISSMSRTTGYPIAILSLLVAAKKISNKGVIPLEILGQDEKISKMILDELKARNIIIREQISRSA